MQTVDSTLTVICPYCKKSFELGEAILHPLREELQIALRQEYDEKFEVEKERLEKKAITEAQEQMSLQLQEAQSRVSELSKKLDAAQKNELELRKERQKLEDERREIQLEIARKVDEQTKESKQEILREYELKFLEKDKVIEDLVKQVDDLKRRAEQGSQQLRGEVLELRLENILEDFFPEDTIEPVPKGTKGADVIQRVKANIGPCCGLIIWESKNTRTWSNSWIPKLKDNQREIRAEIAVLATATLPDDISDFGLVDDIWVTHWSFVPQLACALRLSIIEANKIRAAMQGSSEKASILYEYLTGTQFEQRVEAIASAFKTMRDDLSQEKVAMERLWNKREQQINSVLRNTACVIGDIEGIVGALPQVEALQLPYQVDEESTG